MAVEAPVGAEAAGCGDAEARLRDGAAEAFGGRLRAAWLSGSFVYNGARPCESDIDVVVVLDGPEPVPADVEVMARIRRFVDVYLSVHDEAGLDPDLEFPGEYVAPATLAEVFEWRGLAVEGEVAREFPPVPDSDYWLGRPDRWFNAWLSMTAFSRFLAGDEAYHAWAKGEAWKTIARFMLLRSGEGERLTAGDLWAGLGQFGAKPRYHALRPMEEGSLAAALEALEADGSVRSEGGVLVPRRERLDAWEREMAEAIARSGGDEGPLVLPPPLHREIEDHAAARWGALRS